MEQCCDCLKIVPKSQHQASIAVVICLIDVCSIVYEQFCRRLVTFLCGEHQGVATFLRWGRSHRPDVRRARRSQGGGRIALKQWIKYRQGGKNEQFWLPGEGKENEQFLVGISRNTEEIDFAWAREMAWEFLVFTSRDSEISKMHFIRWRFALKVTYCWHCCWHWVVALYRRRNFFRVFSWII